MYTKLVQNLLNTNVQNKRYYGKSDLCLCCQEAPEDLVHVFTCPSSNTRTFRSVQQNILWGQLSMADTPDEVQQAIQIGVLSLERSNLSDPELSPLTRKAFNHQTIIGWSAFLRGRISKYWCAAYAGQDDFDSFHKTSFKWAGQLVVRILTYSQHLWVFRCGVIHGHTKEEGKQRHRDELIQQIQSAYEEYHHDPHVIPNSWRYLFNRPQPSLTCSDRDTLSCWLKSFSEARQIQALHLLQQQTAASKFFRHTKTSASPASSLSFSPTSSDTSSAISSDFTDDESDDENSIQSIL